MSKLPAPRYSLWQAMSAALNLSMRAIEEVRALSREPGPKGDKGDNGQPGVGFDDLDVIYDGERTITLRMTRGDLVKDWPIKLPVAIYKGVYKPDTEYEKGDVVSYGGSSFFAQRDTSDKPETSDAWRLGVKRGRDGKDAKMLPPDAPPSVRLK